jgi:rRNA-processing protein FCF1
MRVLIDTCVIIDALQSRAPFAEVAQKIFLYSANKQFDIVNIGLHFFLKDVRPMLPHPMIDSTVGV